MDVRRYIVKNVQFHAPNRAPAVLPKLERHSTPSKIGWRGWFMKYFWEGQSLSSDFHLDSDENELVYSTKGNVLLQRYRRLLGLFIPALIIHFFWWCLAVRYNFFRYFEEKYIMSLTMIFGSIFAGMTSEGGGAVAFPVMTLLLGVKPTAARDFSVLIQSVGMTAAMFTILFMQVQIVWHAVILGVFGGAFGLIVGLEYVDGLHYPAWKKMGFVCVWFSFAFALFLLNRYHKRKTYRIIPYFNWWKAIVLIIAGAVGGLFTSFAGSGIDICMFSCLTLLFRVSEKTATPTSVVMMAIISIIGAFWRAIVKAEVEPDTYEYFAVCVPIVVFGAPIGSVLGSHFHRQVLAGLVYVLDTVALITAFVLVPQTPLLAGSSVAVIVVGFIFFFILTKLGHFLMGRQTKSKKEHSEMQKEENGKFNDAIDMPEDEKSAV